MVRRARPAWALALLCLSLGRQASGQAPTEYEVKAAFLYNFGKFVEWPSDAFRDRDPALVLGILGTDPFGETLDRIVGAKQAQGRRIAIRRLKKLDEIKRCHILFVSASEEAQLAAIMRAINGAPVLTVSDMQRFTDRGGAIDLYLEQRKVRFNINLRATDRARLKMSSQLLKIAAAVRS
jgi:hypothetical protein